MPWIDSELAVDILRDTLRSLGYYAEALHLSEKPWINQEPQPQLLTNAKENELFSLFPDYDSIAEEDEDEFWEKYEPVGLIYDKYGDTWITPSLYKAGCNKIEFLFPASQRVDVFFDKPVKYDSDRVICFGAQGDYSEFCNYHPVEICIETYHGTNPDGSWKIVDKKTYASAEHYYQMKMAEEFDPDGEALKQMGNHLTAEQIKSLGRKTKYINTKKGRIRRLFHMRAALGWKFGWRDENLQELLLGTGDAVLAYACPIDTFWGIGYSSNNPKSQDLAQWRGRNVLGNMLMYIRQDIRDERKREYE